jgi:hypothetical protein
VPGRSPGPCAEVSFSCPKFAIGSHQSKSQSSPSLPGSVKRFICLVNLVGKMDDRVVEIHTFLRSLSRSNEGEIPPWTQKKRSSTRAVMGRAQKDLMHASYTRAEYLCRPETVMGLSDIEKGFNKESILHSRLNVKYSVRCRHSWFPRSRVKLSACHSFRVYRYNRHCR